MLLDEPFDILSAEPGQFSEADAGQAGLLPRDVVVDPAFADRKPLGDFDDREETIGVMLDLTSESLKVKVRHHPSRELQFVELLEQFALYDVEPRFLNEHEFLRLNGFVEG